jgi:uncharacterized membrane protein YGL010W
MFLRRVALVKSLRINLLSVSQLLNEGFHVHFKTGALVCWILEVIMYARSSPWVKFSEPIFLVCWLSVLLGFWCFGGALEMA